MPDYTISQFDTNQYHQAYATLAAICGPNVAEAFMRYYGSNTFSPDQIVNLAKDAGLWSQSVGMYGPQAEKSLLDRLGIPVDFSPQINLNDLTQKIQQGYMGAISTPGHYFALQGYDPNTGLFDTGNTGTAYAKGGNRYLTLQQMQNLGGGAATGQFIAQQLAGQPNTPIQAQQAPITPQSLPQEFANKPYAMEAYQAAINAGIDPNIFLRQINRESGFNVNAGSKAGAQGIAQIVPKYHPGVNPYDPIAALNYAANLDKQLLQQYKGDYTQALVAYNGGQGAVSAWNSGSPYDESRAYINDILSGQIPAPFGAGNTQAGQNMGMQNIQQGPRRPANVPDWVPQSMWGMYSSLPHTGYGGGNAPIPSLSSFNMPYQSNSIPTLSAPSGMNWAPAPMTQPNLMTSMSRPWSLYG